MTLPIAIHSSSTGNSPASDESSNLPHAPLSPSNIKTPDNGNNPTPQQNSIGVTQMKRKPSRRANTAERRATHNAVERQRRETLNGRFLVRLVFPDVVTNFSHMYLLQDLAALLPNLSQIRRPSKSAIVNSSIAHIHVSRRHRLLASRELKQLKVESDAQRRELNEWRDRAGLPRVEEPVRGEGFTMVLNGEVEVLTTIIGEDDEDGADGYDGYEDCDEYAGGIPTTPMSADNSEDIRLSQHAAAQLASNTFGHNAAPGIPSNGSSNPNSMHLPGLLPHATQGGPIIVPHPSAVSFENPAMSSLYEPTQGPFSGTEFLQQGMTQTDDKVATWNAQLYSVLANSGPHQQLQQLRAQRSLFTPPASAHGLSNGPTSIPATAFNDNQAFFANFQRQQLVAMHQQHSNMGHMYSSPDGDDSSSVGSAGGRRRERSGSLNSGSGSGYGSPQNGSPLGNYEIAGAGPEAQSEYEMPKRFNAGLQINTGVGSHWDPSIDRMNGLMKQNITPPISIGGGGNGNGFAMMMMM